MLLEMIKKVNWRILTMLMKKEASLSDLARETKTTKANTFYALMELEKHDIVRKTIQGRTHLYRFNSFHPSATYFLETAQEERRRIYVRRLDNLPVMIHTFLAQILKTNYQGCLFFGSSIDGNYNDVDVFIIVKKKEHMQQIEKKLKLIDKRISPLFGLQKELEMGFRNKDMLYHNVVRGIPFEIDSLAILYHDLFLKKMDIQERFVMGLRDILSCLEFTEKEYHKIHLERGIMDFIYAVLHYFDYSPKNDGEALLLFKEQLHESKPISIKMSLLLIKKYAWIL